MTKEITKKSIIDAFSEFISKNFTELSDESVEVEITKALDEEQRRAMFVVLAPNVVDLHEEIYTEREVEKACSNYNLFCQKANLFHRIETEEVKVEQSFISPSTFTLDDGREITKGTWLQWWYFPETEVGEMLWKAVKAGEITGVSIQCRASVEQL